MPIQLIEKPIFFMLYSQMKNYPLAVISPSLGKRSETFIYRHMAQLLPGQTVVVVRRNESDLENIDIRFPYFVSRQPPNSIFNGFIGDFFMLSVLAS